MAENSDKSFGFSRRWFLKGVGATAGMAALPLGAQSNDIAEPVEGLRILGRQKREITLNVNGRAQRVSVEPRTTLLDALRTELGLTGSKEVCSRGSCGGCTVLIDGASECSCMTLAMDAVGHEVTTIEGLADDRGTEAMIQAFVENDGAQCGFCIPGFVVRARQVLAENPRPTLEQIKEGLAGNICRCGTHSKIFEAMLAASGQALEPVVDNSVAWENEAPRDEVREKITGAAKYTADIQVPGMLHASYIRFPHGAGRITEHNIEAVRAVPGVIEVEFDTSRREPRYPGERLGHVLAETRDAVEDAMEALNLGYRPGAPRSKPMEFYEGVPAVSDGDQSELDALFGDAAIVVESDYTTEVQTHSCLEPHGCVFDHRGDSAEAWGSTQACSGYRESLQRPSELSGSDILFHCEHVGGGFGSKLGAGPSGDLAARLSKKHGRPVRSMHDRREEHWDGGNRPGSIQHMKIAADAEGRLLGGRIHVVSTVGHHAGGGGVTNPMVYRFGGVKRTEDEISLSAGSPAAFRAPGRPQGCFAVESMIDEIAERAGLDPLAMRDLNDPSPTRRKMREQGAALIGWERRQPSGSQTGRVRTGLGVGHGHWAAFGRGCQVDLEIHRGGRVELRCGIQDMGTGSRTLLRDVTAHALGIDRELITSRVGRSDYPPGPASGGSVTSRLVSCTAQDAAAKAIEAMKEQAAEIWGVSAESVTCDAGTFSAPGKDSMTWEQVSAHLSQDRLIVHGSFNTDYDGQVDAAEATSATQFAEVEVDTETGVVRVKKIVAIQACGQAVNRLTAENQIHGGVIQGVSFALFEDRVLDAFTGAQVNPNLEFYKIAGPADIPEIIPVLHPNEWDTGVRSIGEPVTIPTAGAIANAVANAIGARVRSLPITPQRVLEALERGGQS